MLLLGLSSGHKLGLALAGAIFAGFSLFVSMLIPRWRPQFPGRGLPVFLVIIFLLFLGMLASVEIFGKESKSEAAGGEHKTTSSAAQTTTPSTTASTTKSTSTTTTTAAPAAKTVKVAESEWKVVLPKKLAAGKYTFQAMNDGKIPHDLAIDGPGVKEQTSQFAAGKSATLTVTLKPGTYDFYCSIPGHKQAGMDQKVTVS